MRIEWDRMGCESPTLWLEIVPRWATFQVWLWQPTAREFAVQVKRKEGSISVWNNGAGLPVQAPTGVGCVMAPFLANCRWRQMHREHQCYVPELVFGLGPGMGAPMAAMAHSDVVLEADRCDSTKVPCFFCEFWGQLLTSDNYDDNEKKVVGGRNGAALSCAGSGDSGQPGVFMMPLVHT